MTETESAAKRSIWPKWGWVGPGIAVFGVLLGAVGSPWQAIPLVFLGALVSGIALLVGALRR